MDAIRVDVAIVGSGPAGSTASLILARKGCNVAMIDKGAEQDFRIGEGLPPAARPLLQSLGIFDQFQADGHLPSYGNASAWGSSDISTTEFAFDPYGHGWHLDRLRFDAALCMAAREAGAKLLSPARLISVTRNDDLWRLRLQSDGTDRVLVTPFVVDCSGRRASFATKLGVSRLQHDQLVGVFGLLNRAAANDFDGGTLVESASDGWWYTSLVPNKCRVIAYFTDADLLDKELSRSHENWCEAICSTIHIRHFCEHRGFNFFRAPRVRPANSSRLAYLVGEGWTAAGDAALSFDPLSSQGIVTAIESGRRAAVSYLQLQLGNSQALDSYIHGLEQTYSDYLSQRLSVYSSERRWLDREFWQRRSSERQGLYVSGDSNGDHASNFFTTLPP